MTLKANSTPDYNPAHFALGGHMHLPSCACSRTNRANKETIAALLKNYYRLADYIRSSDNSPVLHLGISGPLLEPFIREFRSSGRQHRRVRLSDYLHTHHGFPRATVATGAWEKTINISKDFSWWNASIMQKKAISAMKATGDKYLCLKNAKLSRDKLQ
ncbi:MAG: hypothetical protein GF401_06635 [Chitinivibrionales bacterium]|nr:hypothetical protein [Chitinivibrionales bacterium]